MCLFRSRSRGATHGMMKGMYTDRSDNMPAGVSTPDTDRKRSRLPAVLLLPIFLLLFLAPMRVDWHERAIHQARLELDHESHLIGRMVRFIDEELVAVVSPRQLEQVNTELRQWWTDSSPAVREAFESDLDALLRERLTASFDRVRARVGDVADWRYAVGTNYRLLYEMGREATGEGDLDGHIARQVGRMLLEDSRLEDRLEADMAEAAQLYARRLLELEGSVDRLARRRIRQMAESEGRLYERGQLPGDAVTQSATAMEWDALRRKATDGLVVQPAVTTLTAGVVAAGSSRLAGSVVLRGARARMAGKAATRAGARATGSSAGLSAAGVGAAVCGPFAVVCAPVAGLAVFGAAWFATDYALTRADETLHREAFEAELYRQIDAMQASAIDRVNATLVPTFSRSAAEIVSSNADLLEEQVDRSRSAPSTVIPHEHIRGL